LSYRQRSFSALNGTVLIVVFFSVLAVTPLFFYRRTFKFDDADQTADSNIKSIPVQAKLGVFRHTGFGKNKKVTLEEILKSGESPILVNFWATWCPPCLEELPSLENFYRQLSAGTRNGKPLAAKLVTISVDDRLEDITSLESTLDFKPTFPVLHDKEGELARSLGTTKFPETYLVNNKGEILYKWLGPQNWLSQDVLHQLKLHTK
jgi:thiol-disulfide isomerase/thioredoxin